ncbi:FAD-dependent oxidoreductase, partial [Klebsiella pneumoniae]|uniref:FAD-dependent oxidoreductase n=1 Tax=Klebsiella pneumoniae TaxID=573 RepID=UPI0034E2F711
MHRDGAGTRGAHGRPPGRPARAQDARRRGPTARPMLGRRRLAHFWRYHSGFTGPGPQRILTGRRARRPSSKHSMDVIVIGGGISGVATAYQLRAAGHRVCVVER